MPITAVSKHLTYSAFVGAACVFINLTKSFNPHDLLFR